MAKFNAELGKVVARSWSDPAYKARLLESPDEVLKEAGIDVPEGNVIEVVEQAEDSKDRGRLSVVALENGKYVLTLPREPADGEDSELDDEQLAAMAGGICCCCDFCW